MLTAWNRKMFQHLLVSWGLTPITDKACEANREASRVNVVLLFFVFFSPSPSFHWHRCAICILDRFWIGFDFRWTRQQPVKLFQLAPFHASFHTIILSRFDCPEKHGSCLMTCRVWETKKKKEKKNSLLRQRIETPNSPTGLFVHKNSKV